MRKYHFKTIDSTSSYLKSNYEKYDSMTFVSANFQTKGHGRNNRKWISKDGENLLFSILIKENNLLEKYDVISLYSAVCIYNVLRDLGLNNVMIKWPNDVFVNDKKIAGILLESISCGSNMQALVLGVGINVNSNSFEEEMLNTPTSVSLEINKSIPLENFKDKVYKEFIQMFNNIKNNDTAYLEIIRNNNYLKGKRVYANVNNKKILVEIIDINEDNSLRAKINDDIVKIYSGEITFHV